MQTFWSKGLLENSIHTSVKEQVAKFLHVVGHNLGFRVMHDTFRRSMETIPGYFRQVLYAIGELRGMIVSPTGGLLSRSILA